MISSLLKTWCKGVLGGLLTWMDDCCTVCWWVLLQVCARCQKALLGLGIAFQGCPWWCPAVQSCWIAGIQACWSLSTPACYFPDTAHMLGNFLEFQVVIPQGIARTSSTGIADDFQRGLRHFRHRDWHYTHTYTHTHSLSIPSQNHHHLSLSHVQTISVPHFPHLTIS